MSSDQSDNDEEERIVETIRRKAEKKKQARKRKARSEGIWFGLGLYGLVGWSVSVPTLAGLSAGIWLDRVSDGGFSWTLTLLAVGVAAGCLNAWYWISHERKSEDS